MLEKDKAARRVASPYNAAITREQFLFYEIRTTAKLVCEGISNDEVADRIVQENLFQYRTEKSVRKMALACIRRLECLEDQSLVRALAKADVFLIQITGSLRSLPNTSYRELRR